MGEAVKRIHENTPMSPLFRLEEKGIRNKKKDKKREDQLAMRKRGL